MIGVSGSGVTSMVIMVTFSVPVVVAFIATVMMGVAAAAAVGIEGKIP